MESGGMPEKTWTTTAGSAMPVPSLGTVQPSSVPLISTNPREKRTSHGGREVLPAEREGGVPPQLKVVQPPEEPPPQYQLIGRNRPQRRLMRVSREDRSKEQGPGFEYGKFLGQGPGAK